jgi:hypothetical protein
VIPWPCTDMHLEAHSPGLGPRTEHGLQMAAGR